MLTPAEEMGLSGLRLASRVRKAFQQISEPALIELMERIRDQSLRRHLVYLRDGEAEIIRIMPCPVTVLPEQLAYIHYVSQTILNALKRLPELYFQDAAVQEVLRLPPAEEKWLADCWGKEAHAKQPRVRATRCDGGLHQRDVEGFAPFRGTELDRGSAACT